MRQSVRLARGIIIGFLLLDVTACARRPRPEDDHSRMQTVTICDSSGCAERPKNYASFDPAANAPDDDPGGRIAALEQMAKADPRAAYDLALRYFRGDGVRQDSYKSVQWMRDAAERGFLNAQKALGRLYLTGLSEMGADPTEAHKWLSITASRGDREAAAILSEVAADKEADQSQNAAYSRWRTNFYNSWYSGYRYNWYWGPNSWVPY